MAYEKINEEELEQVTGGSYQINVNTKRVGFTTSRHAYTYKNCSYEDIQRVCNSLIGKYATMEEYDSACEAALKAEGWI